MSGQTCTLSHVHMFPCTQPYAGRTVNIHARMIAQMCNYMFACMHEFSLSYGWEKKNSSRVSIESSELSAQMKHGENHQLQSKQPSSPSLLLFHNGSQTSCELMRVKMQPSFSQEDMLNGVTTRLPRGKIAGLTLPLSEMAADAKTVLCFAERCSSI